MQKEYILGKKRKRWMIKIIFLTLKIKCGAACHTIKAHSTVYRPDSTFYSA